MLGYWDHTKNAPEPIEGEWFLSGDAVSMAPDGAITFLGRDDDILNAGGFRVSPVEVEAAFNAHPDIQECAAVEAQVGADTTLIALYYVSDHEIDGLDHFASDSLARYKQPRIFLRIDALPKSANGKIQRRVLRERADNGQT